MGTVFENGYRQDLTERISVRNGGTLMFSGDSLSHEISVALYRNGEAESPEAGTTCVCYVIRPDGGTVTFAGDVSGNTVSAALPQSCFAVPGQIGVALQLVKGTTLTTVFKALYTVERITTGTVVDPGNVIPSIAELLDELDDMREATEAAEAVVSSSVRYDAAQTLTDAQMETARGNIGAAADSDVVKLAKALVGEGFCIAVQPQDVTAAVGDTAQISVAVLAADLYHAEPDPVSVSYQWQYRAVTSSGSWTNSAVTGATTAKISIPVTSARYNYDWRCAVTGGGVTEYSASARILEPESNAPSLSMTPMNTAPDQDAAEETEDGTEGGAGDEETEQNR